MEKTTNNTAITIPTQSKNKIIIPAAIVVLLVLTAIGAYAYSANVTSVHPTPKMMMQSMMKGSYKDGTYTVVGNYVSPGGPREIDVTITLNDDIITDSVFVGKATDATSKRFQGEFSDNYKTMVIGKNIDEVSLTKVSGSSLIPKGFMDAVEKIKAEAQG